MLSELYRASRRAGCAGFLVLVATALAGCTTVGTSESPGENPMRAASEKNDATEEAVEDSYIQLARTERDIAAQWKDRSFEDFLASVYREPNGGKYIVNGDTPIIDIKHLREFFEQKIQTPGRPHAGLIVMNSGGVDAVWSDAEKRGLAYCVSNSFGTRHTQVVDAMASAAGAWEGVADINFLHSSSEDGNCTATNNQVVFDVRPVSGGNYLARAFFPGDPRSERNVLIDDSAFDLDPNENLSLTGILRHELGHTLGFRHEHTRPDAGQCFEDNNWRPLTEYRPPQTSSHPLP